MKLRTLFAALACFAISGLAMAAEPENFIVAEAIPTSAVTAQSTAVELLDDAVATCQANNRTPLIDDLAYQPVASSARDAVTLRYICVPINDARLKVPADDASNPRARVRPIRQAVPLSVAPLFGWDMTYGAAFDFVEASRLDTMRKYFRDTWLQAEYAEKAVLDPKLFDGLKDQAIDAAIMVDAQSYYGRGAQIRFAVGNVAEERSFNARNRRIETRSLRAGQVRDLAKNLLTFEPLPPEPKAYEVKGGVDRFVQSGYVGVVSVYLDGRVRQFPIHSRDLSVTDEATHKTIAGRLSRLLEQSEMSPGQRQAAAEEEAAKMAAAPLLSAAREGDVRRIQRLARAGADLYAEDDDETALLIAADAGQAEVVEALLALGVDPNRMTAGRSAPLTSAAYSGDLKIVKRLLDAGANPNIETLPWSPLNAAISARLDGNLPVIRELVARGAHVDGLVRAEPPLIAAIQNAPSLEVVSYLLSQRANVNVVYRGRTPLMEASTVSPVTETHRTELVDLLIDAGAAVDFLTADCWSALSFAKHMGRRDVEEQLLAHGAKPGLNEECKNKQARDREAVLAAGASPNIVALTSKTVKTFIAETKGNVLLHYYTASASYAVAQREFLASSATQLLPHARLAEIVPDDSSAREHKITAIPTMILFRDGKEIARKVGFKSREDAQAWLDKFVNK